MSQQKWGTAMTKLLLAGVSASALALVPGAAIAQSSAAATIDGDLLGAVSDGVAGNEVSDLGIGQRLNAIDGLSYRDASGIHSIQQNNGSANRILTATSVQIDAAPVLTPDVDTSASVAGRVSGNDVSRFAGSVEDPGIGRVNAVADDAFVGQAGVLTIQQNNGDANDIGAATAAHSARGGIDDLTQSARTAARVDNNSPNGGLVSGYLTLANEIGPGNAEGGIGPFGGLAGVVSVQQNNGTVNAMGIANAVAGVVGVVDAVNQTAEAQYDLGFGVEDQFLVDMANDRSNTIIGAFDAAARGMAAVQQNNGDVNVMGVANAVLRLANPDLATTGTGAVSQSALAGDPDGIVIDRVDTAANLISPGGPTTETLFRSNLIGQSFAGAAGIFSVQQNNGSANVMAIANAVIGVVAVGDDGFGGLDQTARTGGQLREVDVWPRDGVLTNTIGAAFNGATGWTSLQQNNGDANAVTQATAVAAASGDSPGRGDVALGQTVAFSGAMIGDPDGGLSILSTPVDIDGDNTIVDAFQRAAGLVNVQQNNGNANVIGIADAIAGDQGALAAEVTQSVDINGALAADGTGRLVDVSGDGPRRRNSVAASFEQGFNGVATVQQNNGDGNIIGAATAVVGEAPIFGPPSTAGTITQTVTADGMVIGDAEPAAAPSLSVEDLDNTIENDSFDDADGIITVQQNNGGANIIAAATAVAATVDLVGSTGTTSVSQTVRAGGDLRDFSVFDFTTDRDNLIENALDRISGVATVQQNNGNANIMSAALGLVASTELDLVPSIATTTQEVTAGGDVASDGSESIFVLGQRGEDRRNEIDNAFNDADGVFTIQQNNGDANVMASAMGVAVTDGGGGFERFAQAVSTSGTVDVLDIAQELRGSDDNGDRRNVIGDETGANQSVNDANMWATFQQNNGSGNAILSSSAVTVQTDGDGVGLPGDTVTSQTVSTEGNVDDVAIIIDAEETEAGRTPNGLNDIGDSSFAGSDGAVTIQQNNGDANVLGAAVGILAADGSDDIDAVASQTVAATGRIDDVGARGDGIGDVSSIRENAIDGGAFAGYRGIFAVQQNNGAANVLGSAIGVVASFRPLDDNGGSVTNRAAVDGTVTDSVVAVGLAAPTPFPPAGPGTTGLSNRENVIDDAFNGAEGVGSVIQNNGDVNAINSAIAVAAHGGSPDGFTGAVSSTALDGVVSNNSVTVFSAAPEASQLSNTITGSFQDFSGVATIIQNNGSANALGSAVSVTANF